MQLSPVVPKGWFGLRDPQPLLSDEHPGSPGCRALAALWVWGGTALQASGK